MPAKARAPLPKSASRCGRRADDDIEWPPMSVCVERSRDTHQRSAMSRGISIPLDANGTIEMTDPERIPVIIGVGQVNDRPEDPDQGLDSFGLMVAAMKVASETAGVPLSDTDSLATVDQLYRDRAASGDSV